ncbi:MAG: hypothetical protein EZS28_021059 [Streblomastix strix]|uniref:Uncharacterized protein n=1 Tax=Streblomastix strix TaxID=222440 RepID=A0A5J4VMB4_9EUKA|nr:MAG: hypothetical protein EZS28_021059 [Streblomastix strix]
MNKQIADFHFKIFDSNVVKQTIRLGDLGTSLDLSSAFHLLIVQQKSQLCLEFEFLDNFYTQNFDDSQNQALTNIIRQSNGANNATNKNEDRDQNNQLRRRPPSPSQEQGRRARQNGKNSNISGMRMESNKRGTKTGTEKTVKQTAQLIWKQNYLELQFQETSFFLNTMDHQKEKTTLLRGRNTTIIMNKTGIPDINWQNVKLSANFPAQLIQIPQQITMFADAASYGSSSTLEK